MQGRHQAFTALAMSLLLGPGAVWCADSATTGRASVSKIASVNPDIQWLTDHPAYGPEAAISWLVVTAAASAPSATRFDLDAER